MFVGNVAARTDVAGNLTWRVFSLVSECTRSLGVSPCALTRRAFAGSGGF